MKTELFHLEILPVSAIVPHEEHDETRTLPIVKRLQQEKILLNPILVAPMGEGSYLQLDGMNRWSAFRKLGIPTILAQIIDYRNQEQVQLASWLHLFADKGKSFLTGLREAGFSIERGSMKDIGHRFHLNEGAERLLTIIEKDKSVWHVERNGSLSDLVHALHDVVSLYRDGITRDVLPHRPVQEDIEELFFRHSHASHLVLFPTFSGEQVMKAVREGALFPSGITRHIVRYRCLNASVPLSLFGKAPLAEQNKTLDEMLLARRARVYEEPTVYFE